MVYTCFLCKWRSDKYPRRSYHKFPSNGELKQKWLDILKKSDVSIGTRTTLCNLHFEEDCFRYGLVNGRKILKDGSLPTLNLTKGSKDNKTKDSTDEKKLPKSPMESNTQTPCTKPGSSNESLPKDEFVKEKWVNIIRTQRREDDWMPTKYSTVCSQHFPESDIYITKNNCRKLKNTALPLIQQDDPNKSSTPKTLERVNESNENTTLDTPGKTFLMTRIRKISQAKRILQVRNHYLARRNKRLKEKCNNLKQIVSDLLLRVRTMPHGTSVNQDD